jgi:hypothetical protein
MNKTKLSKFVLESINHFTGEKPIMCPHCGAYIEAHLTNLSYINVENYPIYLVIFHANCCNNFFFATYKVIDKKGELLTVYPSNKPEKLPDAIIEISPRFVELYNQAYFAEQNNFFELAGSGYRNSLEVLIKDYAIKELNKSEREVCKKNLNSAIGEYMPSIKLTNSADVVRVLGNDYTHYERKYTDIDFGILKRYLHIFINAIENEYLINHPLIPTNRSQNNSQN